jgi:hypothetical protein
MQVDYPPETASLLVSGTSHGVEIWDTKEQRLLCVLPTGHSTMAKSIDGLSAILCGGTRGISRWPIEKSSSHWRIGPPEMITTTSMKIFDVDASSRYIAALQEDSIVLFDLLDSTRTVTHIGTHDGSHQISISPDGKWIATTAWHPGSDIKIWDRESRDCVAVLSPGLGAATASFSPDSQWLASAVWKDFSMWKVGTWELKYELDRSQDDDWSPTLAFTSDSSVFASLYHRRAIQLVATATGERIAILESMDPGMIGRVTFNADDSQLATVVDNRLVVWNLNQVREELSKIGLTWEWDSDQTPKGEIKPPATIELSLPFEQP